MREKHNVWQVRFHRSLGPWNEPRCPRSAHEQSNRSGGLEARTSDEVHLPYKAQVKLSPRGNARLDWEHTRDEWTPLANEQLMESLVPKETTGKEGS